MVRIRQAGPEAKARLVSGLRGPSWKQPYLDAINGLSGDDVLEFGVEEGETLRQVRVRIARAAQERGRTLLAWLAEAHTPLRRGRRRKGAAGPTPEPDAG